jgi:prepilin-type N-terminal cleavage/methylation domain-containing protein
MTARVRTQAGKRRSEAGFTLIELMAVVIILGILAAVAIAAYSKQIRSAHRTEVIADLSNLTLRQKTFFAVSGHYASSTNCEGENCTYPRMSDINANTVPFPWDVNDPGYTAASHGEGQYFRGGADMHGFDALRFLPEGGSSWCGYATISGHGTNAADSENADEPNVGDPIAGAIFPPTSAPHFARDWFYSYALCDFDFDGVYWAFSTAHYESNVNSTSVGPYFENE